jgi:hypothetical protein
MKEGTKERRNEGRTIWRLDRPENASGTKITTRGRQTEGRHKAGRHKAGRHKAGGHKAGRQNTNTGRQANGSPVIQLPPSFLNLKNYYYE